MPLDQDIVYRVRDLERTVGQHGQTLESHGTTLASHAKKITEGRTNETHLVKAIEEVKQEIKSFKNYALATMLLFLVSLIGALWAMAQGGVQSIPPG